MWAAIAGNKQLAEILLTHGPDIHAEDQMGQTPLMAACRKGHEQVALVLPDKGADAYRYDALAKNALMFAESSGLSSVTGYLRTVSQEPAQQTNCRNRS